MSPKMETNLKKKQAVKFCFFLNGEDNQYLSRVFCQYFSMTLTCGHLSSGMLRVLVECTSGLGYVISNVMK